MINPLYSDKSALQLIGNQSNYDISVEPFSELREYLNADRAKYSYYSVGYNIFVSNTEQISTGDYIRVTSPKGNILYLGYSAGLSYLPFITAPNGTFSNTSLLRLAGEFVDASNTTSPKDYDNGVVWASSLFSKSEIQAIPNYSQWKFEAYDKDGNLLGTEYRRTIARSPTLEEAKLASTVEVNAGIKTGLKTGSAVSDTNTTGVIKLAEAGTFNYFNTANAWTVTPKTIKWSPTTFKVYGNDFANGGVVGTNPGKAFDDTTNFSPVTRKASVSCSDGDGAGNGDTHCVSASSNQYTTSDSFAQVQWLGRDPRRVLHFYTLRFKATN